MGGWGGEERDGEGCFFWDGRVGGGGGGGERAMGANTERVGERRACTYIPSLLVATRTVLSSANVGAGSGPESRFRISFVRNHRSCRLPFPIQRHGASESAKAGPRLSTSAHPRARHAELEMDEGGLRVGKGGKAGNGYPSLAPPRKNRHKTSQPGAPNPGVQMAFQASPQLSVSTTRAPFSPAS